MRTRNGCRCYTLIESLLVIGMLSSLCVFLPFSVHLFQKSNAIVTVQAQELVSVDLVMQRIRIEAARAETFELRDGMLVMRQADRVSFRLTEAAKKGIQINCLDVQQDMAKLSVTLCDDQKLIIFVTPKGELREE